MLALNRSILNREETLIYVLMVLASIISICNPMFFCYCCCVLLRSTAAKDSSGMVWLEENTLPVVVLGALCNFLFGISFLACVQPR
jgi:hypothetical protein